MPLRPRPISLAAVLLTLGTACASASSTQAWEEFRRDVETSCRQAAEAQLTQAQVVVDPFGSQSYGLALVSGTAAEDGSPQSMICVYDKASRSVEIGGVMALERTVPALRPDLATPEEAASVPGASASGPSPSTERLLSPSTLSPTQQLAALGRDGGTGAAGPLFAGLCDAACTATLDSLATGDRDNLVALPDQIGRTVAANAAASLGAEAGAVREAAEGAAAAARGEAADVALPRADFVGQASCTLYYFGYGGEAARTVGSHQCAVTQGEDGALVVEKTSGERLRADVRPLLGNVAAFVGRTFEAGAAEEAYDPENPQDDPASELGNTVGFAAQTQDELLLISSQRRRFEESDSFFWVLALDRP